MSVAIKVSNVTHKFKDVVVLNDISIEFEKNKIYGVLGKNGTGKTTLLNIITNQLVSQEGSVEIENINLKEKSNILKSVCIVKEREFPNGDIKVKNIFEIYSCFHKNYDKKLEDKLCSIFNINKKKYYKKLSRGTKTLISNIIGICSNAPITIFDEPTIGLDALNRAEFYNLILESYI